GLESARLHEPERIRDLEDRSLRKIEQGYIVEQPGGRLLVWHRLRDVIDRFEAGIGAAAIAGEEFAVPDLVFLARRHEVNEAAAESLNGRDHQLARPDGLREARDLQSFRATERARNVVHADPDGAYGSAMHGVVGSREAFRLAVDHEIDPVLAPAGDVLRSVPAHLPEAERREHRLELRRLLLVGGEFDEFEAVRHDARRQLGREAGR